MSKIFRYELHRLLWNKVFFAILAVCLAYGYLTLSGEIILGVSHTAPFSPWSFGYYLSRLLPVICLGELFFVSFFTSRHERRVAELTGAAPADMRSYALVRCCSVLLGTLILAASVIALAGAFFYHLFHWSDFTSWLLPAAVALIAPLALCLSLGWTLGRICPALVYAVMALPFLLTLLPLPQSLSFSLDGFFTQYPLASKTLDPSFIVPFTVLAGRLALMAISLVVPLLFRAVKKPS